jgi:hypothetical protein
VMPERITAGMNDWIALSKDVLARRRAAAAAGRKSTAPDTDISEDHHELRPFGAQHCPAQQEVNQVGWLLKWPQNAVFQRTGPHAWQVLAPNAEFYRFHTMSSFSEEGHMDAISVNAGWVVVTPPGWSTLIKNVPNNLSRYASGLEFAEGVVRTDQATVALQVHVFLEPNAPKEVVVTRGEPMCLVMPFKREKLDLVVMDDAASVEETARLVARDRDTFANAPGRYRALYIEDENLSPLYPSLAARREKK